MRWGKDKMVTGCVPADDGLLSSCHCSCAPPFCPGVPSGISAELSAPFTVLFSSVEKVPWYATRAHASTAILTASAQRTPARVKSTPQPRQPPHDKAVRNEIYFALKSLNLMSLKVTS